MNSVNHDIACHVSKCRYNFKGSNCTLDHITVGCSCNDEECTCCENYREEL